MEPSNHANEDHTLTEDTATPDAAPAVEGPIAEGNVIDRGDHSISRRSIPENVLKVLYRLHRSGYRAYLCGGSVRDLLMERTPKDFDVVTDAHPGDVHPAAASRTCCRP